MLTLHELSFSYDERPLISAVNSSIYSGQWMMIKGSNGAGKSTLLRLIVGLINPTAGQVLWEQNNIQDNIACYYKQLLYLGHANGLTDSFTIDTQFNLEPFTNDLNNNLRALLNEGIEALGLTSCKNQIIAKLSKGQQRKVSLLRLWISTAKLWILDEPFASLDQASATILRKILERHLEKNGILILTSHQEVGLSRSRQVELSL